jgi:hypothetical protein
MKLSGRQSTNIEDRREDTSIYAPHRDPNSIAAVNRSREAELKATQASDAQRVKDLGKNNPMAGVLAGMDREYHKARAHPASNKKWIPVPTERPDPEEEDTLKGGMKPKPRA